MPSLHLVAEEGGAVGVAERLAWLAGTVVAAWWVAQRSPAGRPDPMQVLALPVPEGGWEPAGAPDGAQGREAALAAYGLEGDARAVVVAGGTGMEWR